MKAELSILAHLLALIVSWKIVFAYPAIAGRKRDVIVAIEGYPLASLSCVGGRRSMFGDAGCVLKHGLCTVAGRLCQLKVENKSSVCWWWR